MVTLCESCGWPVEPDQRRIEEGICGFCAGSLPPDHPICFDGAACTREDRDCSSCVWLGGGQE